MEPQPYLLANFPNLAIARNNLTTGKERREPKRLY
jgi:hypothetical protein